MQLLYLLFSPRSSFNKKTQGCNDEECGPRDLNFLPVQLHGIAEDETELMCPPGFCLGSRQRIHEWEVHPKAGFFLV